MTSTEESMKCPPSISVNMKEDTLSLHPFMEISTQRGICLTQTTLREEKILGVHASNLLYLFLSSLKRVLFEIEYTPHFVLIPEQKMKDTICFIDLKSECIATQLILKVLNESSCINGIANCGSVQMISLEALEKEATVVESSMTSISYKTKNLMTFWAKYIMCLKREILLSLSSMGVKNSSSLLPLGMDEIRDLVSALNTSMRKPKMLM